MNIERPTLFKLPNCSRCDDSYNYLTKDMKLVKGVNFDVIDLSENPQALSYVKEKGYRQAPVFFKTNDEHWSGHLPEKLKTIA